MNRAWIPAGALAGVSVAGLIALGPLTDSLGTRVQFPPSATVGVSGTGTKAHANAVSVSLDIGQVGRTNSTSAALTKLSKGGRQTPASTNSDSGFVAVHEKTANVPPAVTATVKSTPKPVKKAAKRPSSIGASAGPNGDQGLAGGSAGGTSATGGTKSTLPTDSPTP